MSTSVVATKSRSLLRSTGLVSVMTLLSRVLGFVRDMLIAQLFGAQAGVDAFFVAFKIPNFMRRLFAEGAFSQAFVPVLAEYQKTRDHEQVRELISHIVANMAQVLFLLTVICVLISPILIKVFAPGFESGADRAELAAFMLKITFPYLMLVSLTAMAGAILNTYGHFGVPAFTPVLLNVSMIVCAIYLAPLLEHPVTALAWGVLIAGVLQLLFQLPFLARIKCLVKPRLNWLDSGVVRVLKLMVPALFGVSIAQINLLLDTVFASFLMVGSVSWLYYSDRLTNFPLGVFGVAIATVILPHLSRQHAGDDPKQFSRSLDWGIRLILMIALPSACGLAVFAKPIIASLLAYGQFSAFDLAQTQRSLIAFACGIPAFMLVKVLASGFYAKQNIKTPVKVGAVAMLVNTLLCLAFIVPLKHAGLALASALASYVNVLLLLRLLIKQQIYQVSVGWWLYLAKIMVATLLMGGYLLVFNGGDWMGLTALSRLVNLLGHIVVAMGIYSLCLFIMGIRMRHLKLNN